MHQTPLNNSLDRGLDYDLDHGLDYDLDYDLDHGLDCGLGLAFDRRVDICEELGTLKAKTAEVWTLLRDRTGPEPYLFRTESAPRFLLKTAPTEPFWVVLVEIEGLLPASN